MGEDIIDILTEVPYRLRIMGTIIVAELLMLCMILFWPVERNPENIYQDIEPQEETITIEDVAITTQRSSPPPPPTPQVPVPVPNDQVIEEELIVLEDLSFQSDFEPMERPGRGPGGDSNQIASNPDQSPSLVRIVEPTVPESAQQANIKAEIWVSFLVNTDGGVEEATISKIRVYDEKEETFRVVESIEYGLPKATLEAALRWKFRPARVDGKPVRAYTEHIFSFGF